MNSSRKECHSSRDNLCGHECVINLIGNFQNLSLTWPCSRIYVFVYPVILISRQLKHANVCSWFSPRRYSFPRVHIFVGLCCHRNARKRVRSKTVVSPNVLLSSVENLRFQSFFHCLCVDDILNNMNPP